MGQVASQERIATEGVAIPTDERRVVRAIDETQDPRDAVRAALLWWSVVLARGATLRDLYEMRWRLEEILHECDEALIAIEWTDAGERRAAGYLLGQVPARVDRYERSIRRRAREIGYDLPDNVIPFPTGEDIEGLAD